MPRAGAARRYAKALFQLAQDAGTVDSVRAELNRFTDALEGSQDLRDVLLRPLHPAAERRAVLSGISDQAGASDLVRNFYTFLIDQRRLVDMSAIREEFEFLADELAGLMRATVRSAAPLRQEQFDKLQAALSRKVGHEVQLSVEVDPELIGGLVAQVGDLVLDGSLRTQLTQLRASLGQH
ncbi:MAG: F0F1 ATP synthase subunit delta [Myxococcota bacterium]